MKTLGEKDTFLGIKIIRNKQEQTIQLVQSEYIDKILKIFNMEECKQKATPIITRPAKKKGTLNKVEDKSKLTNVPYRAAMLAVFSPSHSS